jgi:hypothetical protein
MVGFAVLGFRLAYIRLLVYCLYIIVVFGKT